MALPGRNSNRKMQPQGPRNWRSLRGNGWCSLVAAGLVVVAAGCASVPEKRKDLGAPVSLPFMRMEPNECYFLDEFMPTPDSMVTGRATGLFLRYYTFDQAIYKVWDKERVMLAFYSRDNRCWSLFEEYQEVR